jgi:hypothetical protein
MTTEAHDASPDLIRWTFTVDPDRAQGIEAHLDDLGADVWVRDGGKFQVTWEEPEGEMDEVIEALWSIHGVPFDVTQEEFRRLGLHVLQHDEGESALEAA